MTPTASSRWWALQTALDFQPQVVQLDREVAVVHTPRRHEVFGIER